jgi:hypothetical protein
LAIVEVFETGRLPQFGLAQAGGESAVLALRALTIDEEPEAFFKAEGGALGHLHLLHECVIHPVQAQGLEFVQRRMV